WFTMTVGRASAAARFAARHTRVAVAAVPNSSASRSQSRSNSSPAVGCVSSTKPHPSVRRSSPRRRPRLCSRRTDDASVHGRPPYLEGASQRRKKGGQRGVKTGGRAPPPVANRLTRGMPPSGAWWGYRSRLLWAVESRTYGAAPTPREGTTVRFSMLPTDAERPIAGPAHAPPVGRPPAGRRYFKRPPRRQWSPVIVPRIGERERRAITEAHALKFLACPVQMWRTAERLLPESARATVSLQTRCALPWPGA